MNFIDRLIYLMKEKNVTAYKVSKDIGVSNSLISKWQKNTSIEPSSSMLLALSEYFQVTMKWLLTGEGEMYKDTSTKVVNKDIKEELQTDEKLLLNNYRKMDEDKKLLAQDAIVDILISPPSRPPDSIEDYGAITIEEGLKKVGKSIKKLPEKSNIPSKKELEISLPILHN